MTYFIQSGYLFFPLGGDQDRTLKLALHAVGNDIKYWLGDGSLKFELIHLKFLIDLLGVESISGVNV